MLQAPQGADTQCYLRSPLQARGLAISDTNVWKYTKAGSFVWKKTIPAGGGTNMRIRATSSKIWVCGPSHVHELDSSGGITWSYNRPSTSIGLDSDGTDAYVVWGSGTSPSIVEKLNSSGVSQWNTNSSIALTCCALYGGFLWCGDGFGSVGIRKYNNSTGAFVSNFLPSQAQVVWDVTVDGSDLIIYGGHAVNGNAYVQSYDLTASPPSLNWTWFAGSTAQSPRITARVMADGANIWICGSTARTNDFTGNSGNYADTWKLTGGGSYSAEYDTSISRGIHFDGTNAWVGDKTPSQLVKLDSGLANPTTQTWGTGEIRDITDDGTDILLTGKSGAV